MSLIRPATLRRLQSKIGPTADDGQIFLQRDERVQDGVGHRLMPVLRGPVPARISFDPERRVAELEVAEQPSAHHTYLVELPAYTQVDERDKVLWAAPTWHPGSPVFSGHQRIPTVPNGMLYRATGDGSTGSVEPDWPTVLGATVEDGELVWICLGEYKVLQIIEVSQFDTYEVTRDVWCELRT